VRDLTGEDLRDAILGLAAADVAVANDSGLLHVAAPLATPAVGIFGPSSPHLTGPLNPLAAAIEPSRDVCSTCGRKGCTRLDHRRTEDIPVSRCSTRCAARSIAPEPSRRADRRLPHRMTAGTTLT
jgi:lipopolysaccharide heptosyltransferase II